MRLDTYSNPIYNSSDVFNLIYQGNSKNLSEILVEIDDDLIQLENISNLKLKEYTEQKLLLEDFDKLNQAHWFMPDEYKNLDIEKYIIELTPPWDPCWTRVQEELQEFKVRNMLNLLKWLKFFVDTCSAHNIVWGVGRGSSVASYVLYLMGVHQIDSIKYNLDWQEFLR